MGGSTVNQFFRQYWAKLLFLLLIFAAVLRMGNMFAALEYDEIWTMTYFSSKGVTDIFTELALPNNQPMNSLLVKFAMQLEVPVWGIRLHSFISGLLAVLLMIPLGTIFGGSRRAGFWSGLFLTFCLPAAAYSQSARGYELQLMFLLLYANGLAFCHFKKWRIWAPAAMLVGGVCSILTLPTSAIYLGVITLSVFLLRPRMPGKAVIAVLAAGVIFSGLWYGLNLKQFQSGQQFGTVISSFREFGVFCLNTLEPLIPLLWLPFIISGAILAPRKRSAVLLGGVVCVLVSALVTRGGPPRVYIPLTLWASLICGSGVDHLCRKLSPGLRVLAAVAAVCCCAAAFYYDSDHWKAVDWYALFDKGSSQSEDTLVIYSGTAGFPVMWNNQPKSLEDNAARIAKAGELRRLFCVSGGGSLNGVDSSFNEQQIKLRTMGVKDPYGMSYGLERITVPAAGDEIIVLTVSEEKAVDRIISDSIVRTGEFLRLNIFFEQVSADGKVSVIRGGKVKTPELFNWRELPENILIFKLTGTGSAEKI